MSVNKENNKTHSAQSKSGSCEPIIPHPNSISEETSKKVQDILVKFWNDISNRSAGEKMFADTIDIMGAYREITKIIEGHNND